MQAVFIFCLILRFLLSQSYVILDSCPPGCECFERNTVLECKEAHLTAIPIMRFARNIKRLVLRGNMIERVHEDELKRYSNLEYLDLSDNEISTLSRKVFNNNLYLKEINLGLNPFLCNCDLQDFSKVLHDYIKSKTIVLTNTDLVNCAAPKAFVGIPVLGIAFQDEYNKKREKEKMYIGQSENRGIAICPKLYTTPKHVKLEVKTLRTTKKAREMGQENKREKNKTSPNFALIISTMTAAVLVTCVAAVTAVKYFLKKRRLQSSPPGRQTRRRRKKEVKTFPDKIRQQRRASRGYPASDCSTDEGTPSASSRKHTTYFKAKLNDQRRQSQGYSRLHATSGSASDLEDISLNNSE